MESDDDWVLLPDEPRRHAAAAAAPREADNPLPPALPATAPAPAPEAQRAPVAPAADEDEVAPPPFLAVPAAEAVARGADSPLFLAALVMLAYCLFSALLQRMSTAWAPAVQRVAFGTAVAAQGQVLMANPTVEYNSSSFAPAYVFQGPTPSPLRPLRVTLPCAMCVADADAAACLDCTVAPFARYGQALRERRDVARPMLHRSHAAAGL